MWPSEALGLALGVALPSVLAAAGVWLLITTRKRALGTILVAVPTVFMALGLWMGSQPMPRLLFELDQGWLWNLHFQFEDAAGTGLLFLAPVVVAGLAAIARRKGKRFVGIMVVFGFAPTISIVGSGLLCNNPQAGCGFVVGLAGLVGVVIYNLTLVVALIRAIVGPWQPLGEVAETDVTSERRRWTARISILVSVLLVVGAGFWYRSAVTEAPEGWVNKTYHPYPGHPGFIQVLGVEPDGAVWTSATQVAGDQTFERPELGRFDGDDWLILTTAEGAPESWVGGGAVSPDASVWIALRRPGGGGGITGIGITRYHDGQWDTYTTTDGLGSDHVVRIEVSSTGEVWACAPTPMAFDNGRWVAYEPPGPDLCSHGDDLSFAIGPDGVRWEAGRNGIYRMEPDPNVSPTTTTVLPTSEPTAPTTTLTPTTLTPTTDAPRTTATTSTRATVDADLLYSTAIYGLYPGPLPGSDGYFGSGCSPGTDGLPDGIWWGYLRELTATSVTFDLVCIRFNDDPAEESGWLIENSNPKLRTVSIAPDALVTCEWAGCPAGPYPYREWMVDSGLPHGDWEPDVGVWLFVNGGVVTEIGDMIVAG